MAGDETIKRAFLAFMSLVSEFNDAAGPAAGDPEVIDNAPMFLMTWLAAEGAKTAADVDITMRSIGIESRGLIDMLEERDLVTRTQPGPDEDPTAAVVALSARGDEVITKTTAALKERLGRLDVAVTELDRLIGQ